MAHRWEEFGNKAAKRDLKLEATRAMVSAAIDEGRVGLAFQPVFRSGPRTLIAFHEGLIRIRDRGGRTIPAGEFIPAIEDTSLVQAIDRIALQKTLDMLRADPRQRLSVNISMHTIGDEGWMNILNRSCHDSPHIADRLIVELTEATPITDPEHVAYFMDKGHKLGCSFAIDDFGAGYTGFSHFRKYKFDIVKIDGQFIRDLPNNRDNQVLVEALVKIAQQFDMLTVAEFVETAEESALAQKLGVDALQGFYHGRSAEMPICLNTSSRIGALA
ncbi:MAG: EAL domain-containing protein [Rhodobacteraceae bacterium]|nr:EAL domain-containing protein [Paracoccaceae bacterium]